MCPVPPTLKEFMKKTSTRNAKKGTIFQTLGTLLEKISF